MIFKLYVNKISFSIRIFKNWIQKLKIVKRIFARAISYIKNFFNKIYERIAQSFKDFIEFMDFEPQIRFNNVVRW